jgi:hypothetical protein
MNGMAQVIGCLLMYAVGKNSALPLQPWRTLFLVCGGLTCGAGILFFFLMPNGPKDAWFLTAREKEVLSLRMAKDREGGDKTAFSMRQLKESLLDVKVLITMQSPVLTVSQWQACTPPQHYFVARYLIFIVQFASLVIKDIGYDIFETMLYTAPSGVVQVAFLWIGVVGCWLFPNDRTLVAMALCIPPLIGCVLLMQLTSEAGWGMIASAWLVRLHSTLDKAQSLTDIYRHRASPPSCRPCFPSPLQTPKATPSERSSAQCSSSATAQAVSHRLNFGQRDLATSAAL